MVTSLVDHDRLMASDNSCNYDWNVDIKLIYKSETGNHSVA